MEVLDAFSEARVSVFVVDACRDNPFPKLSTRSIGATRGLARPEPTTGQIVILSAGRDQKALDSVPGGTTQNGLFTSELVQVIRKGNPEVRGAFETVKERVDDVARKANHQQRPAVSHDLRGDFYFFPGSSQQVAALTPTPQPAAVFQSPSNEEIEQLAWNDASRINNLVAYEAFLSAYPSSRFAGRARIALAALTPVRQAPSIPSPSSLPAPPPVSLQGLFDSATIQKVSNSGIITMGVREAAGAFSYNLGDGKYGGYHVELCQRMISSLEKSIGKRLEIRYLPVTSQNRIPLVQNGTVDIECGSTTNNATRQRDVAFLMTTLVTEARIAVRANSGISSLSQLNGKRVATTTGTTSVQLLRRHEAARGVDFSELFGRDHADSFQLLENNRADAFVMDDLILAANIANSRNPGDFRIVGEALSLEPIAVMIRKDDSGLKRFGDDAIREMIRSGELARIYDKWFVQPIPPRNTRVGLPASSATRAAWTNQNDNPMESYARR